MLYVSIVIAILTCAVIVLLVVVAVQCRIIAEGDQIIERYMHALQLERMTHPHPKA